MSRAAACCQADDGSPDTIADHLSKAIDELVRLQPIASGWRSHNQTVDLIDDVNRIGRRLARAGRR